MSNWFKNLLVTLVSISVALLVVEFGLRIFETESYAMPITVNGDGYIVHTPKIDRKKFDNESHQKVHIKTNELGFMGEEFTTEKPSSTFRIALIGDSFTEALQVNYIDTTAVRLEKALGEYLKTTSTSYNKVEVYNFGLGGTTTADQMLTYAHYVRQYKPNVLVLNFYSGNDVGDAAHYLPQRDQMLASTTDELATLRPFGANESRTKDTLYRSSAIIRLFDKIVREQPALFALGVKMGLFRTPNSGAAETITYHHTFYSNSPSSEMSKVFVYERELLERMQKIVEADGTRFVPVFIPEGEFINEKTASKKIMEYTSKNFTDFATDTIRTRILASSTLPWIDLTDEYQRLINIEHQQLYLNDAGHFTVLGHERATAAIMPALIPLLN